MSDIANIGGGTGAMTPGPEALKKMKAERKQQIEDSLPKEGETIIIMKDGGMGPFYVWSPERSGFNPDHYFFEVKIIKRLKPKVTLE